MESEAQPRRGEDGFDLMRQEKHAWGMQKWTMLILLFGILAMSFSVYGIVKQHSFALTAENVVAMMPPLMFGLVGLFLLAGFYMAQREVVVNALREELLAQKIESELNREMTLLDPVTEVYNRRYARVILTREASRVRRYHTALALMLVDVTGFRHVNESIGHNGGDVVLRQIAQLLQSKIRNSDIIVRFGGDEFLLILPDAEKAGIDRLEIRIKQSIIDWAQNSGMADFHLRFAVGVGFYRGEGRIDEILSISENRMVSDRGKPDPDPEKLELAAGDPGRMRARVPAR